MEVTSVSARKIKDHSLDMLRPQKDCLFMFLLFYLNF